MKILIVIMFLLPYFLGAQILEEELSVIASGGKYSTSILFELHSSVGETTVHYGNASNNGVLNGGFLQNLVREESNGCGIELEPILGIDRRSPLIWDNLPSNGAYTVVVFHQSGNILESKPYSMRTPFTGSELPVGNYLYAIVDSEMRTCLKSALTISK